MTRYADRPIKDFEEDKLGYSAFAKLFAKSVLGVDPSNGFVFSLNAPWGSGKSSALALIDQAILQTEATLPEHSKSVIINFNPWQLGGREDLYRAFFQKLSEQFEARKMLKAAEAAKNIGHRALKGIGGITSLAAAIWSLDPEKIAEKSAQALQSFIASDGSKKSLDDLRNELITALKGAQRRIIVIIDDLDRLMPEDIRETIALVKSLGDLPFVIYILSFDESVVQRSIRFLGHTNGSSESDHYLEKLIQAPFDLPVPDQEGLDGLLFSNLNEIFDEGVDVDQSRWSGVIAFGLRPLLDTPRAIKRLSNSISAIWPAIKGEVDVVDFVSLEAIRLSAPSAYRVVRQELGWLNGGDPRRDSEDGKLISIAIDEVLSGNQKRSIHYLIASMFPRLVDAVGWKGAGPQTMTANRIRRRVCVPEYSDHYFRFAPRDDFPTVNEVRAIITKLNNEQEILAAIASAEARKTRVGTTLAGRFLVDLTDMIESQERASGQVLSAILKIGDALVRLSDEETPGLFSIDNAERLRRLMKVSVKNFQFHLPERSPAATIRQERKKRILSALEVATSIFAVAQLWTLLATEHGLINERNSVPEPDRLIDDKAMADVNKFISEYFERNCLSTEFFGAPKFITIVLVWSRLSSVARVKDWLSQNIQNYSVVLNMVDAVLGKSRPVGERIWRRTLDENPFPELFNLDEIEQAAVKLLAQPKEISSEDIRMLEIFVDLKRQLTTRVL